MPSAKAADLGGDCCADLEERVAELEATTARKGNRRVSLTISGQVTTHLMYWNDGNTTQGSDIYVADNVAGAGTFVQFAGQARINPNVTVGFQLAFSFTAGARSLGVTQLDDDGGGPADTTINSHLSNWWIDHKALGRLTVGRTNTATAGITTIDLGGAGVIANASIGFWQRAMRFTNNAGVLSGSADDNWGSLMGGGTVNGAATARANAVLYSSPIFGGLSVQAAFGEDDIWDAALRYAGEFGGIRVAAGIGYAFNHTGTDEFGKDHLVDREISQWKGSASILHVASGLYLTGAYVDQDNDAANTRNTTLWYVQGGISKNWTGLGSTVLYGEYAQVKGGVNSATAKLPGFALGYTNVNNSEVNVWGIGVVQHIDAAAMELYLAYRRYSAEVTNFPNPAFNDPNDMDVIVAGARIRF